MCAMRNCNQEAFTAEGELRGLPAGKMSFALSPGYQLRLTFEGRHSFRAVRLVRCFPISDPGRHISVRCAMTDGNPEIGVIHDLERLRPADRRAAEMHLAGTCLVPSISEVRGLRRDLGFLYWRAETDRGQREFATRDSQDGVTKLPDGGAVVTDTDECRYRIPAPSLLNRASRSLLARYLFL